MPGPMPPHHPGSGVVPHPPGMPTHNIPHPMPDGRPLDHGRHTPYFGQPDYRIYEMNKRLQLRTEDSDNLWWDTFATEFFEDDATLTLTFCLEDGPKRYTIGRTLIPRYFRSIFEGGVTDLYFHLKHPKESFHNTTISLDCDQCFMITHHGKPVYNKGLVGGQYPNDPMKEQYAKDNAIVVCTEGRLILEFTFDDLMRIKSWHFATRAHRELVPRSVVALQTQQQDPSIIEQLSKNITRQGLTNSTLNYLRLCVILEPMQELMSRHRAFGLSPRDCLKTTLFQKWQRMVAPPETQRPPSKRRKRKSSIAGGGTVKKKNTTSPGPANFSLASQDVMVVGEPSLMGGEFGDEDERLITRLENTQYDASTAAANGLEDGEDYSNNPMTSVSSSNTSAMPTWSGPHTGAAGQDRTSTSSGSGGSTTNGPQSSKPNDKKSSPSINH
ncbi:LIM domain-binding protein 2-like isoform X2 [Limulus polyphemus]|uniref:LIM domain-binding protein 2-like isoform X2 n=1 Tax=Limulus polyphemus TaxID=6850 RepID=A0ABM1B5E1_LIMPO|nr:LIM domain-binding protein 2-like isoform X2 [Limulus polyphemus]